MVALSDSSDYEEGLSLFNRKGIISILELGEKYRIPRDSGQCKAISSGFFSLSLCLPHTRDIVFASCYLFLETSLLPAHRLASFFPMLEGLENGASGGVVGSQMWPGDALYLISSVFRLNFEFNCFLAKSVLLSY